MSLTHAQQALKQYFGYDTFRPMQREIVQSILEGKDVLVLMPTGGGKSICYQIPALVLEGVCVVVSPLIALMKDQVEGLLANGVPAAFLNSSQTAPEQHEVEQRVLAGQVKLLYVSPEKLLTRSFFSFMQTVRPSLVAIDEAHCISAWGHDFRPEYTQLKHLKQQFPQTPVVALTATADKATRKDIITQLDLADPEVFVASFDRPNLSLTVVPGQKRLQQIVAFIQKRPGQSGIVYCLSRREAESVAARLNEHGIPAGYYHAGMPDRERALAQEAFIKDAKPIICATVAFGMGIDKSNVRWIIHHNLPKNIESYYQEIGRAGRDGLPSDTLLMYSYADYLKLQGFVEESGQMELQQAKLDRMKQFAESSICRRRMLLSYFGEHLDRDCGNCDICLNPPKRFDGTEIAQKALSAVARMRERVGVGMLIDVLRGSGRKEVFELGYNEIKTYGAGRDISYLDWQLLVWQLLNLGLLEVAYDEGHVLKLTEASREVLFGKRQVELIKPSEAEQHAQRAQEQAKPKAEKELLEEALFQRLRELRKTLADRLGLPPYLIFNDATLQEMAREMPVQEREMKAISGVGQKKYEQFGEEFAAAILDFATEQAKNGAKVPRATYLLTYDLYLQGLDVEGIAQTRQLASTTIEGHIAQLYEQGFNVDIYRFISAKELELVGAGLRQIGHSNSLKPLFEHLGEAIDYGKLRLGTAYWRKQEGVTA
jgi:ATP-dependent DNA helicase RecQ